MKVAAAGSDSALPRNPLLRRAGLGWADSCAGPSYTMVVLRTTDRYGIEGTNQIIWEHGRRNMGLMTLPPLPPLPAGEPYVVSCEVSREGLLRAAADWEAELALYPDCE